MQLITSEEAAQILGVNKYSVTRMTREGLLRARLAGNANMYDPNEVHQLKELRESNITFTEVAARAARAEMAANRLERQVTQLLSVIGADIPTLDTAPEAVVALHLKVQDAVTEATIPSVEEVMSWAQTFQALSEEYFHVVAKQFQTDDPWQPYLELSNRLIRSIPHPTLRNDLELSIAYNYLEMARRTMRQTMFFYVCTTSNKRIAHRRFPESLADVHEDVLAMVSLIVD